MTEDKYAELRKQSERTIFDYIEDHPMPDKSEAYAEVSWGDRINTVTEEYPVPFWGFVGVIALSCAWLLVIYAWKIIKVVLYQITYTITKAIKDGRK